MDVGATADLIAARERLCKALRVTEPGPLRRRRCWRPSVSRRTTAATPRRSNAAACAMPGLRPGMSPVERRKRIEAVLPPRGRAMGAARALRHALADPRRGAGERPRCRRRRARPRDDRGRLRPRAAPALAQPHADRLGRPGADPASRRDDAAGTRPDLPAADRHRRDPSPRASPMSASARSPAARPRRRALTPPTDAPERDRKAAAHPSARPPGLDRPPRPRSAVAPARPSTCWSSGQKAAIDALRSAGLPPRVEAVHFNALSGLDRWGGIGGMVVLGRTLPAPRTVETLATALTGRVPAPNRGGRGLVVSAWSSAASGSRATGRAPSRCEEHADPDRRGHPLEHLRGRADPGDGPRARRQPHRRRRRSQIDLLTDVVLPVTVDALVPWSDLRPTRRDLMALTRRRARERRRHGACFPELWPGRRSRGRIGRGV